jgi:sugar lactone lactonase YvrE
MDLSPTQGTLYRIEPDLQVTAMRTGVSVSNGLDWSPDGRTFYFTDSTTRRVNAYDFDISTGDLSNERLLVEMSDPVATPDGLAVDAEGNLWIAMWDGGCVRQFSAKGRLLRTIELPVSRPTSVAFGGPYLDQLFITSARGGIPHAQLGAEPHAGSIFVVDGLAIGRLPHTFAG